MMGGRTLGRIDRARGFRRHLAGRLVQALPLLLLTLSLVTTAFLYRQQQQALDIHRHALFTERVERLESVLATRLLAYKDAGRGAQALLAANPSTSGAAWRRYVATLDLPRHYPGINGLGVISSVPHARWAIFDAALAAGRPRLILWAGMGFSVLLGALALLLGAKRARAPAPAMRITATARESETLLRTLMTNLPVILFALDADGIFTLSDGMGLAPLGGAPSRVVGRSYRDVHAEHPEIVEHLGRALAGEEVAFLNQVAGHTLDARATPLRDARGRVTGVIGVSVDVTDRVRAEDALRAEEARFRALTEHATDLVCILAPDGAVRYESPSYERLIGETLAAVYARHGTTLDIIHPDDRARVQETFLRVRQPGASARTSEWRLRVANGSWRTFECIVTNHVDDPAVGGVVITNRDITERVAAQEALRADAERLSGVIATQQEVALADLDTRVILPLITARARELTGADGAVVELVEGDEMVYHAVAGTLEGYEGTRLPLAGTLTGLCVRTGEILYCADAATDPRTDPALCRRLGIGSMIVVPLRHGGAVVGVLKVSAVVAHAFDPRAVQTLQFMAGVLGAALGQATVFAALRASEDRLHTVIASAPLILFTLDPDGVYTMSDGNALVALGRKPGAVVGRSVFDVYRDQPDLLDYTRQALAGTPVTFPSHVHGAVFDNHLAPLHDEQGRLLSVIGVSTNITARAHAETALEESRRELERSNAELQQFAYIASHDLQEPLRTVTSYLKLLQRRYQGKLGEDADEFIGYATDGAQRMSALIKAVLEYSRVGTRSNSFAPVDCQAIVTVAVANLEARIAETGARITYVGLPTVLGDDDQLSQLFQNLIGNALKFCRGMPEVTISAERQGDAWLVRVRDNGIGIAPEQAERIFQMFQRLHTRTEYEGTGIGLSLCKRIVERHGGRIWVESEPGQGATFLFTLPGCDAAERSAA